LPNFEKKYFIENSFNPVNNNAWDFDQKIVVGWGVTIGAGNYMKIGLIYTLIQINFVLMLITKEKKR